jgi:hypothetical protein
MAAKAASDYPDVRPPEVGGLTRARYIGALFPRRPGRTVQLMTDRRPLFAVLILGAAFAAGPVLAADTDPIATADGNAALTTAEQIDNYLKTSPAARLPAEGAAGVTAGEAPRKVHGEVEIAVGTGGYRSAYARADLPVGKTGTLSVAVQEGRHAGRFGPGGYQDLSLGFAMGEAAAADGRCRDPRTGEFVGRPMTRFGGRDMTFDREARRLCRAALPAADD